MKHTKNLTLRLKIIILYKEKEVFEMRIISITVAGFKNIKRTKLELGNICAIISPNNYGKSNLIEAISFGFDFIHESRKVVKI